MIEKIIWNLRIKKQASTGCTPFEKHFNRTANTRQKNLISFDNRLDKGKSILSNRRGRNWELHDGAEDGYFDEDKNSPSDPEDNLPLAQIIPSTLTPEVHNQYRGPRKSKKLVAGGKLYTRATNWKNGEPYFNLVKKDIVDSSDHTITLDNGNILQKSDMAIKGKLLPGPKKISVNQPSIGHNSHVRSSLAGKSKLSPPKKTIVTDNLQLRQGTSGAGKPTQTSDSPIDAETTQDLINISSGSSSSLSLNSWDGIIDDYFDDMTNNNLPLSHPAESNNWLSVTGDAHSPQTRPNLSVNTDQPAIIEVPDSTEIEGLENSPILLDKAPEGVAPLISQPIHSKLRRNVGSPQFFGDRRFIDVVLEKDYRTTESVTVQDYNFNQNRTNISIPSSSDLLTPFAVSGGTTNTYPGRRNCVDLVFKEILPIWKSKLYTDYINFKKYHLRILLINSTYHQWLIWRRRQN